MPGPTAVREADGSAAKSRTNGALRFLACFGPGSKGTPPPAREQRRSTDYSESAEEEEARAAAAIMRDPAAPTQQDGHAAVDTTTGRTRDCSNGGAAHRAAAVMKAAAQGATASVLEAVAAKPGLLAHRCLLSRDSLWHMLAQQGQLEALQSLAVAFFEHSDVVLDAVVAARAPSALIPGGSARQRRLRAQLSDARVLLACLLNTSNFAGLTPLHMAATAGHAPVVEFLLVQGADPWRRDCRGERTPLHCAALGGHAACAEALLGACADGQHHMRSEHGRLIVLSEALTLSGCTALHYAVAQGHRAAAQVLMDHNADVGARKTATMLDPFVNVEVLMTPLHLAAHRGDADLIRAILRQHVLTHAHGRDLRRDIDVRGYTPLKVAASGHHTALFGLLHPSVPIESLFPCADLLRSAANEMVPRLALIAAAALQQKLIVDVSRVDGGCVCVGECATGSGSSSHPPAVVPEATYPRPAAGCDKHAAAVEAPGVGKAQGSEKVACGCKEEEVIVAAEAGACKEEEEDGGLCDVCMDAACQVATAPCHHRMCAACARRLCSMMGGTAPLSCPFCRTAVGAFKPL